MRSIPDKVTDSSTLTADEYNSSQTELENLVTAAGITLDPSGSDTDLQMAAKAILRHVLTGGAYEDGGTANNIVLTATTATHQQPTAYLDGMLVGFKIGNTNTGDVNINVESIGAVDLTDSLGNELASGVLVAGYQAVARYNATDNRFEVVVNTSPEPASPAAPDTVVVFTDTGDATGHQLAAVTGYVEPTSYTDALVVFFKAAATNDGTGTHSIQIGAVGSKTLTEANGDNPRAGRIPEDEWVVATYVAADDRFEIIAVSGKPVENVNLALVVASSSGTAYTLNPTAGQLLPEALVSGMVITFQANIDNTGGVDITITDGNVTLGPSNLLESADGTNFSAGEIKSGDMITAIYDGSDWRAIATRKIVRNGPIRQSRHYSNGTWNKPADVSTVVVELHGGCGGGGRNSDDDITGGAGAGGGYVRVIWDADDLPASVPYTVGQAGSGGGVGSNGGAGGDTIFHTRTAHGGGGGSANGNGGSAGGSSGSGGDAISFSGQNGESGGFGDNSYSTRSSGGAGGFQGQGGNGSTREQTTRPGTRGWVLITEY